MNFKEIFNVKSGEPCKASYVDQCTVIFFVLASVVSHLNSIIIKLVVGDLKRQSPLLNE